MALLQILEYPDPRLRTRAEPVEAVDDALRRLIDDMFETMYAAPGIGLAATQVDVHRRLLVADVSENHDDPRVFINPEILEKDGVEVSEEGCLSVPGMRGYVERPRAIRYRGFDPFGKRIEREARGFHAIVFQHEYDHLDGILYPDRLEDTTRFGFIDELLEAGVI